MGLCRIIGLFRVWLLLAQMEKNREHEMETGIVWENWGSSSKLIASLLTSPIVVPYIIPHITLQGV